MTLKETEVFIPNALATVDHTFIVIMLKVRSLKCCYYYSTVEEMNVVRIVDSSYQYPVSKEKCKQLLKKGLYVNNPKVKLRNEGNMSRGFFADTEWVFSNVNLIELFKVIEIISIGAKMYMKLYGWHLMSPNVDKVLMQGASHLDLTWEAFLAMQSG